MALIGIVGSVQLLRENSISEPTLVVLFSLSSLIGLFIGFIDRIKLLNLTELSITLHKIENSKKEIQELAIHTALLVAISRQGAIYFNGAGTDAVNEQINAIIKLSDVSLDDPRIVKIKETGHLNPPETA